MLKQGTMNEQQAENTSDIAAYLSMQMSETLGKRLSRKQTDKLCYELTALLRRGAEEFAREVLKLPKSRQGERLAKVASQSS